MAVAIDNHDTPLNRPKQEAAMNKQRLGLLTLMLAANLTSARADAFSLVEKTSGASLPYAELPTNDRYEPSSRTSPTSLRSSGFRWYRGTNTTAIAPRHQLQLPRGDGVTFVADLPAGQMTVCVSTDVQAQFTLFHDGRFATRESVAGSRCISAPAAGAGTFRLDVARQSNASSSPVNATYELVFYLALDADEDGVIDLRDNCPDTWNPEQGDYDDDGVANACDDDIPTLCVADDYDSDTCRGAVDVSWTKGASQTVPYFGNYPLQASNPAVRRAFVVLPGSSRKAWYALAAVTDAAEREGVLEETLIIAPWLRSSEARGDVAADELNDGDLDWSYEGWRYGADARGAAIGSLDVLDAVLAQLDAGQFDNLEEIVMMGFSAGGQLVQRYAVVGDAAEQLTVPVRYVVGAPSTYLYLNDRRSVPEYAWPLQTPDATWQSRTSYPLTCLDTYTAYPLGPDAATDDNHAASYVDGVDWDAAYARLAERDVTYLVGTDDTGHSATSVGCQHLLQGNGRYERALQYYYAMWRDYGPAHAHQFQGVDGVDHDAVALYTSEQGRSVLFR